MRLQQERLYRERNPWVKTYKAINRRVWQARQRGVTLVMDLNIAQLRELWHRDNASGMKRPSIDRIDPSLGYFFDNCRYMELSKNSGRGIRHKNRIGWTDERRLKYQETISERTNELKRLKGAAEQSFNRDSVPSVN